MIQTLNSVTLNLQTNGRFTPQGAVADIINDRTGGPVIEPLTAEESENLSLGFVYENGSFGASLDVYRIEVTDRFSTVGGISLSDAERAALTALGVPGGESIQNVSFFQNQFDTETTGVDLVVSYQRPLYAGTLDLYGAYNYNQTEVTREDGNAVFNDVSRTLFEEGLPQHNASASAEYSWGPYSMLGRVRYYGEWTDTDDSADVIYQKFGAETLFDLIATAQLPHGFQLSIGAENLFDEYPDESRRQANRGLIYSRNAPYDTDGGEVFIRIGYNR